MDFFAQQDHARKQTRIMLVYFTLAVFCTILLVYFLPVLGWYGYQSHYGEPEIRRTVTWWYPQLFAGVCGGTLIVVLCGAMYKISQLKQGGGEGVAVMLGGKQILPDTADFFEKRLRNIVEEMAIASGIPVPPVYVMEHERGINAFAAGFTPSDSVVAVTYGTMTGLTREELQGVIAHEFSHILNNDMRMNINLMAIIHGLIVIGLIGRILIQFSAQGSRSRSRDSGKAVLVTIGGGLLLIIIGSCGMFFASLIKASISRSRERLADASAVQFTRNPSGLANALKKIGGLAAGSQIRSANAVQASHMFFGNGLKNATFNTHPPVADRVRWLEPTFNGEFPRVTYDDLRAQLTRFEGAPRKKKEKQPDVVDLFTNPTSVAVTATVLGATAAPTPKPNNPEALIDSIGQPLQQHADAAKQLIASIPERVKSYARDPHGARMLVYFLLLDPSETICNKQMTILQAQAEPDVFKTLEAALPNLGKLPHEIRLPIIDLAIPALRFLSPAQYTAFRALVKSLSEADNQIDIFEYALQRVLVRHLDPAFRGAFKRRPTNYYAIRGLEAETSTILSTLAWKGNADPDEAAAAFHAATQKIVAPKTQFEFQPQESCTWEKLDDALERMNEASFKVKKWLLGGALVCLMHDREITLEEVELFRAISDTLDCPVPPWVVPTAEIPA